MPFPAKRPLVLGKLELLATGKVRGSYLRMIQNVVGYRVVRVGLIAVWALPQIFGCTNGTFSRSGHETKNKHQHKKHDSMPQVKTSHQGLALRKREVSCPATRRQPRPLIACRRPIHVPQT